MHNYIAEERNSQVSCSQNTGDSLTSSAVFLVTTVHFSWSYATLRLKQTSELQPQNDGVMGKAGLYRGIPQTPVFLQFTLFNNWCGNSLYIK